MYQAFALSAELLPQAGTCQVPAPNENVTIKGTQCQKGRLLSKSRYTHMLHWPKKSKRKTSKFLQKKPKSEFEMNLREENTIHVKKM